MARGRFHIVQLEEKQETEADSAASGRLLEAFWGHIDNVPIRFHRPDNTRIGGKDMKRWNAENRKLCLKCTSSKARKVFDMTKDDFFPIYHRMQQSLNLGIQTWDCRLWNSTRHPNLKDSSSEENHNDSDLIGRFISELAARLLRALLTTLARMYWKQSGLEIGLNYTSSIFG
ncbi:hypothetical protein B0H16DRAFT_1453715 [Mycena metata]|uniref:Uncharacterized protein n=1 Tax=Mycena metata TaxID=1033252 RepID=A0AAD7JK81_9AGAR|nr:hypothetical protein B0H16DRAFT_1453715 [Mycena metata]